ncbi:methylmalonyl Co-A mutase-associated GTPase MeaB [Evansella cellulosilytica]|uniref:LAO/AO transport system ATPase n=1 Tax=Evansella cellulosilytica (strain ATCC 21833 / DSM 2522 / FERM P-1141 / JCM 9156 / N-4) TaxID=649639 RepID=E6TXE6_EVAC2|nr:methylmalonyl Co-A mutase-associated GTPase MeaB [Evansella cellulosilytica]ADU32341.1 LAO/AO transport system ATPase [Evansella cellulosilytica DSM 2522]
MGTSDKDVQHLINGILAGETRAIAKAISLIEDRMPQHELLLEQLFSHGGRAHIVGITGAPGAGKSTLVNVLVKEWRAVGKKVAVIAVDPTSPFSGGALLGDRVRLQDHEGDDGVYMRSMGTRGSLGGLSEACYDVLRVLDAAPFDIIVVETVGVGQSELDIMQMVHTVALVVAPSTGDIIQAFKAGVMEIADIFLINKADLLGVEQLRGELEELNHLTKVEASWVPPIIETVSTRTHVVGMKKVISAFAKHFQLLSESGHLQERMHEQQMQEVFRRLKAHFKNEIKPIVERAVQKEPSINPYKLAKTLYDEWKKTGETCNRKNQK